MEKVWEELRKIESKAEDIHSETLKKSEELIAFAKKDADMLLSVSEKHIEAEAEELLNEYLGEAAKERDVALENNKKVIKELRTTVEKSFDKAVNTVFDVVLGKIKI